MLFFLQVQLTFSQDKKLLEENTYLFKQTFNNTIKIQLYIEFVEQLLKQFI